MVGRSEAMQTVFEPMRKVARTDAPVLISGRPAAARRSPPAHPPALPAGRQALRGVQLRSRCRPRSSRASSSGTSAAAFTGADKRRVGYFEEANGGTLFLDEITEMSAELQVRLLRVLEEQTLRRVGGTQEMRVDVRLLSATNRDPQEAIKEGKLREDLFYRLERLSALPAVAQGPARGHRPSRRALPAPDRSRKSARACVRAGTPSALELLQAYAWPGNVRELRNAVHRAYIMTEGDTIDAASLADVLPGGPADECEDDTRVKVPRAAVAKKPRATPKRSVKR